MKSKQLAGKLNVSDAEVLRAAVKLGITSVGFKTVFSEAQITAITQYFAENSRQQLKPATEVTETEPAIEIPKSAIAQVPEQELNAPEKPELGIAEQRQTALSNAMAASENQQAHILETELQQIANYRFKVGVIKEFIGATKEIEATMLVRDQVFQKGQKSRDRLNEVLKDSAGDDFLTTSQLSSQTFMQTAEVGVTTDLDVHQALKNLGINL